MEKNEVNDSIDRIMLLSIHANKLEHAFQQATKKSFIRAGMGRPTFPIDSAVASSFAQYWHDLEIKAKAAEAILKTNALPFDDKAIVLKELGAAINYTTPRGDYRARQRMAAAMEQWYRIKAPIEVDDVLFTTGGANALSLIFSVLNQMCPGGLIVTPFPHYSLYGGFKNKNHLFPIDVMSSPGYRLTAELLEKSLDAATTAAKKKDVIVTAVLLCDPNNPLGTVIGRQEMSAIVAVLKRYPEVKIILDEAYAELCFVPEGHYSLLTEAQDIRSRIIVIRSGTKAMSAAGERLAVCLCFDKCFMGKMVAENSMLIGHSAISSQLAFAEGMLQLTREKVSILAKYYEPQVRFVENKLSQMGLLIKGSNCNVQGAFYVLADLSQMLGRALSKRTVAQLGREGRVETDVDIVYYLMCEYGLMVAPLSSFGLSAKLGYVRITCSIGLAQLQELLDRLQCCLCHERLYGEPVT